jgi:hypothetical protein
VKAGEGAGTHHTSLHHQQVRQDKARGDGKGQVSSKEEEDREGKGTYPVYSILIIMNT